MKSLHHWIDGKPDAGSSGRHGPVLNPATGAQEKQVPFASAEEIDTAVAAAKTAFTTWGQTSLARRTEILFRFRALLDANRDAIAELITAEHGKVH
ncbi:aldehyde dehydrogenase family protein, partial [Streptomyces sp. NPDC005811]|uniref:aldehyde dehydrogenase family protein n=1 Tax=Streptomyces sp. NPDC005811 TaxID=3154565 RepID=UPI0033CB5960